MGPSDRRATHREEGLVEVRANGKLDRSDYEDVVPQLEKWATLLTKPLFSGEVRDFEDVEEARRWIPRGSC